MDAETSGLRKEEFRLSAEQQAEIGDILLSARAVSRQMVAQAKEQADEILQGANEQAGRLVQEAEEKADGILRAAGEQALETTRAAEEQAAEIVRTAQARAAEILQDAGAPETIPAPEEQPDTEAADTGEEPASAPAMSEEMQDYVVRCVGDCFARLRQQQLDTAEYISEQWRGFLSGLSLPELPTPGTAPAESADSEVSRQEIEERVSAIAKELMEIISK